MTQRRHQRQLYRRDRDADIGAKQKYPPARGSEQPRAETNGAENGYRRFSYVRQESGSGAHDRDSFANDQTTTEQQWQHGDATESRTNSRSHSPKGEFFGVEHQCLEFCPICRASDLVRATAPPEIQKQWQSWQNEILVSVRALIDYYIERTSGPVKNEVEDIPVE